MVRKEGRFIGYNTDGMGFLKFVKEVTHFLGEKKVLIIGAGGAARASFIHLQLRE